MHTTYVDKPMNGHNLMQVIARIDRVLSDKEGADCRLPCDMRS